MTTPAAMFLRFEPAKSTKGASKLRRDLINAEISNLRDLLPLPPSTRQRLSQLQLMALVCVYVRKMNYFQQLLKSHEFSYQYQDNDMSGVGFSKALNGFMMMLTQSGKLLYISENAAEYLGHSMEDLLIHGDSVYDIIDRQDHQSVQAELNRGANSETEILPKNRHFFCRMNVSRNSRRQMRFGDQKVVLVRGHFVSYLPLCSRNEPVFLAACTPLAMPETRECVVHGATNVFTTIHSMDMKILHIDHIGEWYLGWNKAELTDVSWYQILHWDSLKEAQTKHRIITQSEQDKCCILLVKLQRRCGQFLWVHTVLQVKDSSESPHQFIVATNQVLSDSEASIMMSNPWLYHYYGYQHHPCNQADARCRPYPEGYQDGYHEEEYAYQMPPRYVHSEYPAYDRGPVDYSTHSPHSTISDDRSPHSYEYPPDVSINGDLYLYPTTKREHPDNYRPNYQPNEEYLKTNEHLREIRTNEIEENLGKNDYIVRSNDYSVRINEYVIKNNEYSGKINECAIKNHIKLHDNVEIAVKRTKYTPAPLCLDVTDAIDRWNPSPPWSDSAMKIADSQRFNYHMLPMTPTDRPLCT